MKEEMMRRRIISRTAALIPPAEFSDYLAQLLSLVLQRFGRSRAPSTSAAFCWVHRQSAL
jgi:hypothetical protein